MKRQGTTQAPSWLSRVLLALVLAAGLTPVVLTSTPGTSHAVVASGSRTMNWGAQSSWAGWRESDDWVRLSATPGTLSGNCLMNAFDWKRGNPGHYDSRLVHACMSNTYKSSSDNFESNGTWLTGMQKLGQCLGSLNNETSGTCTNQGDAEGSVTSISLSQTCSRQWSLFSNGVNFYVSGGNVTSCSS